MWFILGALLGVIVVRALFLTAEEELGLRIFMEMLSSGHVSGNDAQELLKEALKSSVFTKGVVGFLIGGITGSLIADLIRLKMRKKADYSSQTTRINAEPSMTGSNDAVLEASRHYVSREGMANIGRPLFLVAIIATLILMIYANPTIENYREFVRQETVEASRASNDKFAQVVGGLFGGLASTVVAGYTVRHDYILFSVFDTQIGEERWRNFGILGRFLSLERPITNSFFGIWEYDENGRKQYLKIVRDASNRLSFFEGYKYQGEIVWMKPSISNVDGIYLKLSNGQLKAEFTSGNFRPSHSLEFEYKITLDMISNSEMRYSLWSEGDHTDERVATKISNIR